MDQKNVEVCGMMHLLISGNAESKWHLGQTLERVYENFSLIHNAVIAKLDDLRLRSHEKRKKVELRQEAGYLIMFCRCSLNRIFEGDGVTIKPGLAELLAEIERHLLDVINNCTNENISEQVQFTEMKNMMERIGKAFFEPSRICYQLINFGLIMRFLHDCKRDFYFHSLKEYQRTSVKHFEVLIKYLESVLYYDHRFHAYKLEKLLIIVENVAYEMARYVFFKNMFDEDSRRDFCENFDSEDIQLRFRVGILKALVFRSNDFISVIMSNELLMRYIKCVQQNISELLKNGRIDMTSALVFQLMILSKGLSFLMHLLITYLSKHNSNQDNCSNITLDIQALAKNVGFVVCSCLENPEIEEMNFGIFDLIDNIHIIKGKIIKTICCIGLENMGREFPEQDQQGSLTLLLQNLKEFMDRKPGPITVNLVLFILYLIRNNIRCEDRICSDEVSNALQLDVVFINNEDLEVVLSSGQVVAFNMASYSLLRRFEKFHWWELYLGTKENVDMHMCVGILEAILLSSTTTLTNKLLIAYGECVQDYLTELLSYTASNPSLNDKATDLHEGFSFLVRLLITYVDEHEELSDIKEDFQVLVRSAGSAVCSCFNNMLNSNTMTSTTELSNLVEKMDLIIVKTRKFIHQVNFKKIGCESPKGNQLFSFDLLLQNCEGLMECESDSSNPWKEEFQMINEYLVSFKSFIRCSSTGDNEYQHLCTSIMDAGHMAEYLLTTFAVETCPITQIDELQEHIEQLKAAVTEICAKKKNEKEIDTAEKEPNQVSAGALPIPTSTDEVVGFDAETKLIKERLTGHHKQLDVISIIGMPGIGKTTLARKVFEDRTTVTHFDVRAWCCVSQEYNKKELFLTILGSIIIITDQIRKTNERELSTMVHQELTGRRYLIVLDDIWSIQAFTELGLLFPDDSKGSRIILTSRIKVTGLDGKHHSDSIELRLLTGKESWDLLEQKVYREGKCPLELRGIGLEIAKKCRGLPLAVVVVAGILAKSAKKQVFWEQVVGDLNSYRDAESHVKAAFELSFKHLPDCLKSMFLYLGAFPEDKEIPADKLMRLWIAEGFVQKTESASFESQAEKNLMDLIDRSLVMISKRRRDGRVKACHVHDLLRDMCLAKGKEEKFIQQIDVHRELQDPVMYQRRISIFFKRNDVTTPRLLTAFGDLGRFSITPPIHSLLFFHSGPANIPREGLGGIAPVISNLKLLKVFDAEILKSLNMI